MTGEKPFIHLFSTPYGYYMFDVNKNIIIKIKKPVYEALINEQQKNDCNSEIDEEVRKEIEILRTNGFLSTKRPKEIVHPENDFVEYRLKNDIRKMTLQVTQQCNLRCGYCPYSGDGELQRTHTNKRMSFETARKAIDFLIHHSKEAEIVNIGFYGGEPLLEFELIKKCVEYIKKKAEGKKVSYVITTNATLLNEEIVEYFEKNDIRISISLDGPREIHNKNRRFASDGRGSFDTVMEKIEMIKNKYPGYFPKVGIIMVIDPENNVACTNEFCTNCETVSEMNVLPMIVDDNYTEGKVFIPDDFIKKRNYELFKVYLYELGRVSRKNVSQIFLSQYYQEQNDFANIRPMEGLPEKWHHGGPCVPGESRLFINADGCLYPCEKVNEKSEVMKIGHIDSGFDLNKVRNLINIGKLTEDNCKNCWVITHCKICASQIDSENGLSVEMKKQSCKEVRSTVENLFRNYIALWEMKYMINKINVSP